MVSVHAAPPPVPPITIAYARDDERPWLAAADTLAVIGFGTAAIGPGGDARRVSVPLRPLAGPAPLEIWRVDGSVEHGHDGDLAWARGGGYLLAAIRVDEIAHGGLAGAADYAYRRLSDALGRHGHRHWLRAWNYLADINLGHGDDERYRKFSQGRLRGIAGLPAERYPAATAIGRTDGVAELLVYALAGRHPGRPVENPRQVSAWRYPRQYGPVPPSFARAMRLDTDPAGLLVSGTASVVGHATVHDDCQAQMRETLRNLASLILAGGLDTRLDAAGNAFKLYLRQPGQIDAVRAILAEHGLSDDRLLCLHGDICRSDLLLEIDGVVTDPVA